MSSSINNRKIPLEELDKDELIKRCKHYLTLAQKAKTSKDGEFNATLNMATLNKRSNLVEGVVFITH